MGNGWRMLGKCRCSSRRGGTGWGIGRGLGLESGGKLLGSSCLECILLALIFYGVIRLFRNRLCQIFY